MHRLSTALGHAPAPLRLDPRRRHQRQVLGDADGRGTAGGAWRQRRRLRLAAPARWSERVLIGGEEIGAAEFAAAVERAAQAAETVNRSLEEGEAVTQFEVATAAAFVAFAAARVEAAVDRGRAGREAGRDQHDPLAGHRPDLDRARPHRVAGRDRARDRRREAGRASRPHDPGSGPGQPRGRGACRADGGGAGRAAGRRARRIPARRCELRAAGRFQRRNFALACSAAEAFLGELDHGAGRRGRRDPDGARAPGAIAESPPTFLDAAHNPDGAAALAEALPDVAGGRPVVACLAVLADKDASGDGAGPGPGPRPQPSAPSLPPTGRNRSPGTAGVASRRPSSRADELVPDGRGGRLEAEASRDFEAALAGRAGSPRRAARRRPARHRIALRAGARSRDAGACEQD